MYDDGIKIGDVMLKNRVFLAPMAGFSDQAYRMIVNHMDCGFKYTEMVSAKALIYDSQHTKDLLRYSTDEGKVAVQIFGHEPDIMAGAARILNDYPFCIIDINMGCPVKKIVANGDGSALMNDPVLVGKVISAVAGASKMPVTVKIRTGWDKQHVNAAEIAHIAEESGAKAVSVHGRTRQQFYTGRADWTIIKQVKQAVNIPIIGNGDIFEAEDAEEMMEFTGCDAVMIGRGAIGNPWIFRSINEYLKTGMKPVPLTAEEKIDMAISHLKLEASLKGEMRAIREMRKVVGYYIKGMNGSKVVRNEINRIESMDGVIEKLSDYKLQIGNNK